CEMITDPTLKAADPFSAGTDAGVFKKEIQDDNITNRDKLVKIWFHRTYAQRVQIEDFYNKNFCPIYVWGCYQYYGAHCPLTDALHEISDDTMDDLYEDSLLSPELILGKTVYEVIMDKWKEVGAIEEIVCANDKEMKDRITKYYQSGM
ncbi:hypothetical protein U1Q18_049859, partial [Sarracenia purpurea var. burkii]